MKRGMGGCFGYGGFGRLAVAVSPALPGQMVLNLHGNIKSVRMTISDRVANKEAFAGEQAFRLPRRLSIDLCRNISGRTFVDRRSSNAA